MGNERDANEGRRDALTKLVVVGSAAFGCALAAPAAVFVTAPLRSGGSHGERWVKTVRVTDLTEGQPKKVAIVADQRDAWTLSKDVELGAVWLTRRGDAVSAFSVVCPHLGCSINAETGNAEAGGGGFGCPCHTSAFDGTGKKVSGPSPRDMDALVTKVEGGFVLVDFRKFRIGVEERQEIG